jgi:hypothetical protein
VAGERPARWPAVAMVALIVAVPVATWWAVGDLSTDLPDPDYQIRPFDIGHTTEQVTGVIGANIGAGLMLWVGAPIVAALVGLAVFDWLSVRAQRQHPGTKR